MALYSASSSRSTTPSRHSSCGRLCSCPLTSCSTSPLFLSMARSITIRPNRKADAKHPWTALGSIRRGGPADVGAALGDADFLEADPGEFGDAGADFVF